MIALQKRYFGKPWMQAEGTSPIKQRYFNENLPTIKPIDKNPIKQPSLRNPSLFPPIPQSHHSGSSGKTINPWELPKSSSTYNTLRRDSSTRPSIPRSTLPSISPRSSFSQAVQNSLPKRTQRYDHITSKINTGLLRVENANRTEGDMHQLGPTRQLNWSLLRQEIENDKQIRAQAKRMQFTPGVAHTTQLTQLSNLVRTKIKSYVASVMNSDEERYKIVVQLSVFPMVASGLHIASRCLWDVATDNSITLRMQGIDCNLLIVAFLCYTDLGAL